jgi:hypothetical protein
MLRSYGFFFRLGVGQSWAHSVPGLQVGLRWMTSVEQSVECRPQIPYDLFCARTRAAAVGSRQLTAWSMARPGLNLQMGRTVDRMVMRPSQMPRRHSAVRLRSNVKCELHLLADFTSMERAPDTASWESNEGIPDVFTCTHQPGEGQFYLL